MTDDRPVRRNDAPLSEEQRSFAEEHHRLLLQSQIAHIDVGRHIDAGQMTNMNTAVGIRQCGGHGCSLIVLLFHVICV